MINNMTIRRKAGIYVAVLVLMVFIVGICLISIVKAEPDEESKDKSLTEQDFYQANDVNFFGDGCDSSSSFGDNKDYKGDPILTEEQMSKVKELQHFYEEAANKYSIPWQILATIHILESGQYKGGPPNGQGPFQFYRGGFKVGDYSDAEFQSAADEAAKEVKQHAGSSDLNDPDNVKKLFFGYNGMASVYKDQARKLGFDDHGADIGEGSPYVMNRADKKRDPTDPETKSNNTWGQIKTDNGPIQYPANNHHGAYIIYAGALGGASDKGGGSGSCEKDSFGSIAEAALTMAGWYNDSNITCYKWGGGHSTSKADMDNRIANKFSSVDTGVDCSGFAAAAVYKATGHLASAPAGSFCDLPGYKVISESEVKPGDLGTTSGHVEVVVKVEGSEIITVGSHGVTGKRGEAASGCEKRQIGCSGPSESGKGWFHPTRYCRYEGGGN